MSETTVLARATPDVGLLIQCAIDKGASAETMHQLYALARDMKADAAREAFNLAIQRFQAVCPPIAKDRSVNTGKFSYRYATLEEIAAIIRPHLADVGLSYSFDCKLEAQQIITTCRIRHIDGHSEVSTFTAPIDGTSAMNVMQRAASATSYANRYALRNALGLTIAEEDDDGRSAAPATPPAAREGGPVAQPRNDRVSKEDLSDLHGYWKETMDALGGDQSTDAFRKFIVDNGGPSESPNQAGRWTREQLMSVGRAVDSLRGVN